MFCQTRSLKVRKVFLEYHPDGLQGQPDLVYIQTGMMRFTPGNSFNEGTVLLGNNWSMPPAPPPLLGVARSHLEINQMTRTLLLPTAVLKEVTASVRRDQFSLMMQNNGENDAEIMDILSTCNTTLCAKFIFYCSFLQFNKAYFSQSLPE